MLWGGFLLLCLLRGALAAAPRAPAATEGTRISHDLAGDSLAIDTLPASGTRVLEDNHSYYISRSYGPGDARRAALWVDMEAASGGRVKVHGILSNTHRQASRVTLSFDFPFYGHLLRQVTIATGGFIFTGDVMHRMLTATQYIAPLMANFNPSYSHNSTVRYLDNGTVFVVQWDKVYLQGKEDMGSFTFQAALHSSGRIVFGYKEIPVPIPQISANQHPVKAGLSDAFMVLNHSPAVPESRRRTIYEYHRVELDSSRISSLSAVEFTPLPTCLQHQSCETCVGSELTFNCSWCHVLQRCSSGFDRYREEWLSYGCDQPDESTCEDLAAGGHYSAPPGSSVSPQPGRVPSVSLQPGRVTSVSPQPGRVPSVSPQPGRVTSPTASLFLGSLTTEDDTKLNRFAGGEGSSLPWRGAGAAVPVGTVVAVVVALVALAGLLLAGIYISGRPTSGAMLFFIQRRPPRWPAMKFRSRGSRASYAEVEAASQEKEGIVEAEQC